MNELEIENHAKHILDSRRIKGKIVFLCEGDFEIVKENPSAYRKLERMPDANFYKKCLPEKMRGYKTPTFFNCGSRDDVINVFFKIRELHKKNPNNSYLDLDKLFAIVDLDIQDKQINNYKFSCIEDIFLDLYESLQINHQKLDNHIIFTTGLIHKEAYFLLRELESVFDNYKNPLEYKQNSLSLKNIYDDIINDFETDQDLNDNFDKVRKRLSFSNLNLSSMKNLQLSFLGEFRKSIDSKLIKTLFLVRKVKPYWEKIGTKDSIENVRLREQLSLEIAKFYSDQDDSNFHLTVIFKSIYKRVYDECI